MKMVTIALEEEVIAVIWFGEKPFFVVVFHLLDGYYNINASIFTHPMVIVANI
jgi:hypothetical protein